MTIKTSCVLGLLCFLLSTQGQAQSAPSHLRYFGFTAIDCFYDDPLDATATTNYLSEVDTFSNLAHMCVYDYTDNIVARTNAMNASCVSSLLHIQEIFFQMVDTQAPSGVNYDLYPDFTSRWATFATTNASVLDPSKVACFYIVDEPFWNGVSLADMDTVCALLKNGFPTIPLLMVEAYTTVDVMEVPEAMDWVGFDRYGSFDPQNDPAFQENMDTLKGRLSSPNQKIVVIIDDQWFPDYLTYLGWTQDMMADVAQNYYDLAVADTSVIGLIGYIWPGGLDAPDHYGVRNLTPAVINKNVEIGQNIKANFSPCSGLNLLENELNKMELTIFPNPVSDFVQIETGVEVTNASITIYDAFGRIEKLITNLSGASICIETTPLPDGIYLVCLENGDQRSYGKFIMRK